ncbi:hypothetical protein NPIL_470111 [Nephila pilipes]|uniref:Fibronectin type-III domain-containing protein n=1 Tax=Nephila pilipes TaxID=299642 RepID=A0A8X6TIN5_NEPPI|nr:hypothetical protein NPIL_470111 [Nephila pilipes]
MFANPYGNITGDQNILVGSPFTYECYLFDTAMEDYGVTSENLILRNDKGILTDVAHIDKYTVKYSVKNATVEDSGIYSCYVPIPNYDTPQLVCSSVIAVDNPPQNVSDFKCISYGFSNLTCTWKEVHNNIHTIYILHDMINGNPLFKRKCPNYRPGFCEFRLDTKPPYIQNQKYLSFMLEGSNSLGTSRQYFRVKHDEIIKPDIPKFVRFSDVRETSVVINISAPKGMEYKEFPGDLEYIVNFYPTSLPWKSKVNSVKTSNGNAIVKVIDLVPHTTYRFEVTCRVVTESGKEGIRSEARNATEITKADVPYLAPVIESSSFSSKAVAGNRSITLYWKPVPFEFENGKEFGYLIEYHEHFVPNRFARQAAKKLDMTIAVNNMTSYTFEQMDMSTATLFTIIAVNEKGASSNRTAVIVIDKTEKLLDGPRDITVLSYRRGEYDISWKAPDEEHYNFTLFWCELLKYGKDQCKGPVQWMQIFNETFQKLYFPNFYANYRFGIVTSHHHRTSGIYWSSCTAFDDTQVKATTLEVSPKTSTDLQAKWLLECEAYEKLIKEFYVYYCPCIGNCTYENPKECKVNGQGPEGWHKMKVDPSSEKAILTGLDPYTCYAVTMQAHTLSGWGDYSPIVVECTMQGAPDDSPANIHAITENASIKVWFDPPTIPNGRITRYIIFYNKTSSNDISYRKEVRVKEDLHGVLSEGVVLDNVFYYTNYSIQVIACVDQACSVPSEPIYVKTKIGYPAIISASRVEIKKNLLNISWDPPLLPNGPIDYYEVKLEGMIYNGIYNVSGQTFLLLDHVCTEDNDNETEIQVRAVNFKNGVPLFGDYGGHIKTILCPSGYSRLAIAIGFGSLIILCIVALCSFIFLGNRIQNYMKKARNTNVQLPKGLESPLDNPLNSYDKFKSGLKNNQDSGIPNDRTYDRLFSSTSEGDLSQTAEFQENRGSSGRNRSGESNTSDKVHNSISSANTTKTHNSMDSGAEVESPLSPDSFSSDSGSINTATPNRTKQRNLLISKDSGLEKEDNVTTNLGLQSKCKWYDEWKGEKMPNDSSTIPHTGSDDNNLADRFARYNSVPSLVRFNAGNEHPIYSSIQPYSKFGVGRSLSHENFRIENQGYSKFGLSYSKFGFSNHSHKPQNVSSYQPQIFSALVPNKPFQGNKEEDPLVVKKKLANVMPKEAYSKFGIVDARPATNSYLSLNDFFKVSHPSQKTIPNSLAGIGSNVRNCANATYLGSPSEPLEDRASPPGMPHLANNFANSAALCGAKCSDLSERMPLDFDEQFIALRDLSLDKGESLNPEKDMSSNHTDSQGSFSGGWIINSEDDLALSSESESEDNLQDKVLVGYVGIPSMTGESKPSNYVIPQPNLTNVSVESV